MTKAQLALSRDEARWLAVSASGLDRRPFRRKPSKGEIMATIERLGSVQLDTISVVSRSHETVLWSRLGPYDLDHIATLYDPDHAITEALAHAAAIVPTSLMPLFRTAMERRRERYPWGMQPDNRAVMDTVLSRVMTDGPISSRDFDPPEGARKAEAWEWYGTKPERQALDYLWLYGELVLRRRDRGFSRVYDLPERVLPDLWVGDPIADHDRDREFIARAVRALGITTARWASDYFRTGSAYVSLARTRLILKEFEASGECIPVSVPGIEHDIWISAELVPLLDHLRAGRLRPTLTTLLSPFDNLIWNRDRTEQLWNFFYRLECYTPEPKRVYGYYTLPILHRGRLVGRLDPSYDRRTKVLTVKALHLEPRVRVSSSLVSSIMAAIQELVRFLGGEPDRWRVLHANPASIVPLIRPGTVPYRDGLDPE